MKVQWQICLHILLSILPKLYSTVQNSTTTVEPCYVFDSDENVVDGKSDSEINEQQIEDISTPLPDKHSQEYLTEDQEQTSEEENAEIFDVNKNLNEILEPGFNLTYEEKKKFKIWNDGVIPYYIDVVSFSDKTLRDSIRTFLQMVNDVTGIHFEEMANPPSNDEERWVFFVNRRGLLGCADHTVKNFTNHGVQQVVLGYDCFATKGELAEAVIAILGVPAQHNSPDRDKYIKVNTENIMPDKKHLFEKLKNNEWLFHDLKYDFKSVTHYDLHKYSVNGRATIEPIQNSQDICQSKTLSPTDYLKIKMLYNFMTRNRKLQIPECEKLFKPRNKFEKYISNAGPVHKPRKKPALYLGEASSNGNKDGDYTDKDAINENEEQNNESNDKENEKSVYTSEEGKKSNDVQTPNKTQKILTKTKKYRKGKKNRDAFMEFSDHDSREYKLTLAGSNEKHDALFMLSDYGTDK